MKKQNNTEMSKAKLNLRLVMSESAITAGLMAMSILTPFFNSIGLNNEQISLTQIIFTVAMLVLNIPLGYVADRFSRKWANIIGDFGHGILLLIYAATNNFFGVVICESLVGIMSALSDGVDQSLLKHFAGKIARISGESESKILKTKTAKMECYKQACTLILLILGGPIGAIDLRLAIALSSVNQFAGGIISIFIADDSEKLQPKHKNPMKDMLSVAKVALKTKPLRWRIFAYAVGREVTHSIIWIATPLFLQAGVPLELVSFAWAFNALMAILGAYIASRIGARLNDCQTLIVTMVLITIGLGVIGLHLSIATVWLYGLLGIAQGWSGSTLVPMVQKHTKPSEQTSVLSLAKVLAQLLYIPAVWAVGAMADIRLEYGVFANIIIFLPLGLIIAKKLKSV